MLTDGWPSRTHQHEPLFLRVVGGGRSRVEAIKVKCLDCTGGLREEVRACSTVTCGLWHVRPYRRSSRGEEG